MLAVIAECAPPPPKKHPFGLGFLPQPSYMRGTYKISSGMLCVWFALAAGIESSPYPVDMAGKSYVKMEGVPAALTAVPPSLSGLYKSATILETTATEHNCDCRLKRAEWINTDASGILLKRYETKTSITTRQCRVVMRGYGWEGTGVPGLVIAPNAPTGPIPAIIGADSYEGKQTAQNLQSFGHKEILALTLMCKDIDLKTLCATATGAQQCLSGDIMTADIPFAACCWVKSPDATPMFAATTIRPDITTGCLAGPTTSCEPRLINNEIAPRGGGIMGFPQRPFSCPACWWLPHFPPTNVDAAYFTGRPGAHMFCIDWSDGPDHFDTRYTMLSTGAEQLDYGSAGAYPGTCLAPYLVQHGSVHPPYNAVDGSRLTVSNASAHYCNDYWQDGVGVKPVPFSPPNWGKFTFCNNDAYDIAQRRKLCYLEGGAEVIVGSILQPRVAFDQACSVIDQICILIPGDLFYSISSLGHVDLTGYTIIYLNIKLETLRLLLLDSYVMDLIFETSINTSPFIPGTPSLSHLGALNRVDGTDGDIVGKAFCGGGFMGTKVFASLERLIEAHKINGNYTFITGDGIGSSVTIENPYIPLFLDDFEIGFENMTIRSAFAGQHATEFYTDAARGQKCTPITIRESGATITGIIFNRSLCTGDAVDKVPIIVVGERIHRATISNITVIDAESAVVFLGGPSVSARWVTSPVIDITGAVVENIAFVYTPSYSGTNMFITAAFGGTNGTAVVIGVGEGTPGAPDTSITPQLECTPQPGLVVCTKNNNSMPVLLNNNIVVYQDISTCGQGCPAARTSLNHGLTCARGNLTVTGAIVVDHCPSTDPTLAFNDIVVDRIGLECIVVFPGRDQAQSHNHPQQTHPSILPPLKPCPNQIAKLHKIPNQKIKRAHYVRPSQ